MTDANFLRFFKIGSDLFFSLTWILFLQFYIYKETEKAAAYCHIPHSQVSPITTFPYHQSLILRKYGTFVTIREPILIHYD